MYSTSVVMGLVRQMYWPLVYLLNVSSCFSKFIEPII